MKKLDLSVLLLLCLMLGSTLLLGGCGTTGAIEIDLGFVEIKAEGTVGDGEFEPEVKVKADGSQVSE